MVTIINKRVMISASVLKFCVSKFLTKLHNYANSADPDQTTPEYKQSDQVLHCLPF